MKKSELRQLIREEVQKSVLKERRGLITMGQVIQAVLDKYLSYDGATESGKKDIESAKNIYELFDALEEYLSEIEDMGNVKPFDYDHISEFIFDVILKDQNNNL